MKWTLVTRIAFLFVFLIVSIGLGALASTLAGELITYNWRSEPDFNRWKEWNLLPLIIVSVVSFVPFAIGMLGARGGIREYADRKKRRSVRTIVCSGCMLIVAIIGLLLCANINPYIDSTPYSAYLPVLMVPCVLILVMGLMLLTKNKLGLLGW